LRTSERRLTTASASTVTAYVITATLRRVKETMRLDDTSTRLPDDVRQTRSRRRTPSRKSMLRRNDSRVAVARCNASPSTLRAIVLVSGTLMIVWPTFANPYAASACLIGHVSWKPFRKHPCAWASASPSS